MTTLAVILACVGLAVWLAYAYRMRRAVLYVKKCQRYAWSFIFPLRIAKIVDDKEVDHESATGLVIRLNGQCYVLTAWHVLRKYRTLEVDGVRVVLLGLQVPLIEPRLIELNQDIGLVPISDEVAGSFETNIYDADSNWSPPPIEPGDDVLFVGHPGQLTEVSETTGLAFGDLSYMTVVQSRGAHDFTIEPDKKTMVDLGRQKASSLSDNLGGVSGAPAFRIYMDKRPQLAGVVVWSYGKTIVVSTLESLESYRLPPEVR